MSETGYLGNPLLKRSGLPIEWTQEMLQEYLKCAQDPIYFSEKYIKIVHVDHGFIPIKLYDYQKEIIEATVNNRRVVCNTSRQAGKTTTAVAIILHYILFNEYKTVALLANKAASALEILSRIQMAYEALPGWLQQGVVTWNKGSMELENGCKVIAAASSSSSIRGKSIAFLYIDETAFLNNWDEFFSSVYPTISSGKETKILLTSTPNSLNHFWKICKEAQEDVDEEGKGKNGYIYIEVAWDRVPGRDEDWKQDTLASIGWNYEQFNQEFNVSFIGSQNTLISGQTLQNLSYLHPIVEREGIKQYAQPRPDGTYVMTVDVSRGKGLDYSTFTVFDCTKMPYTQACTFRDNYIGPIDFASIIYRIGKMYNEASVLIEINDIGGQVADTLLLDYGYENMLFTESAGRAGKRISAGFGGKQNDPGIRTTKSVKAIGCSILKLLVEQNQLILADFDTIQELSRFSRKGGSYEAESGAHDDMVINLVHFAWLTDQTYFKDITDINTLSRLREKTEEQIEEDLLPFGFINSGADDDAVKPGFQPVASGWM
jgi:hypothetical protein